MSTKAGKWSRAQVFMLVSIALATFMSSLDASIVSIAVPTITKEFHTTTSVVSWIIIIYGLLLSSLLLMFGKLADTIGFKRIFLIGLLVFTAGSILSGLATDIGMLIAFRGLQGVGGSIMAALTLAMVSHYLPLESKGKGLGLVSTFMALGIALGPVIGGLLTQFLSWRWIFFVNVPICIIAIIMGLKFIPADSAADKKHSGGFDMPGAGLFFATVFCFLLALNNGSELGWTSMPIIVLFVLSVLFLISFFANERRRKAPMLSRGVVKNKSIIYENLAGFALMGAIGGAFLLMPFYFELVRGQSTSDTGFLLLSASVAVMIFGMLAGKMSDRLSARRLCIYGGLISVLAFVLLSSIDASTAIPLVLLFLFIMGMGFGTYLSPASNLILRHTPKEDEGVSTGLINTMRNLGYIVGLTIMESVFQLSVPSLNVSSTSDLMSGFQSAFTVGIALCLTCVVLAFLAKDAPRSARADPG
ncbi:MAG: MFS transporter [Methanomassiliicoccales archaeon]|nr:MFS transporter [Methanomassiliicoccales archaeon]